MSALSKFATFAPVRAGSRLFRINPATTQVGAPGGCGIPADWIASENSPLSWNETPGAVFIASRANDAAKTAQGVHRTRCGVGFGAVELPPSTTWSKTGPSPVFSGDVNDDESNPDGTL